MTAPTGYSEICPHCEDGILTTNRVPQDILIDGSAIRVPNVQVEECQGCGFRSLSGRDLGLFDLLFTADYPRTSDVVAALRRAGYHHMFLKENESQSGLGFGPRDYVNQLSDDLRGFYLDNESHHIIEGLNSSKFKTIKVEAGAQLYELKLPRLGEGENGIVYEYLEDSGSVLKLAKPRAYSREHLKEEYAVTCVFQSHGIPVPQILDSDPYGSFMIKEKLAGDSLAKIYHTLGGPGSPRHRMVRDAVEQFIQHLLRIFESHPEAKTSVSPNNIFVSFADNSCQCLLVDTGPAPFHDYSNFRFSEYWEVSIPLKIRQYQSVGYL